MPDRIAASGDGGLNPACKRVLIVEDEPIVALALEDMLEELGHDPVGIAADAKQALPILESDRPDVVILDVNLRGAKSYPLADWLDERGIAYVFATGYGSLEHPDRHRDVPTVSKPYSQADLRAVLQRL